MQPCPNQFNITIFFLWHCLVRGNAVFCTWKWTLQILHFKVCLQVSEAPQGAGWVLIHWRHKALKAPSLGAWSWEVMSVLGLCSPAPHVRLKSVVQGCASRQSPERASELLAIKDAKCRHHMWTRLSNAGNKNRWLLWYWFLSFLISSPSTMNPTFLVQY